MAKIITTLFIRENGISLLVMKDRQVDRWANIPLEPGLVSQGMVLDEEKVAQQISELFKLEGISTKKVIVGLSGLNSVYRIVTLPELPEAILEEAVKHEASRMLPVSIDEIYMAYQPVPSSVGETRVYLAAYPRNMTDSLVRTVRQAGLDPYLVDLAPLALCRIPDEPRAIIVNARLDHLNIMVLTERLPQVIRALPLPTESESFADKIPAIVEEFSRTITFYNSTHLEKPLDSSVPVFVCGELADVPDQWPTLVGRLGNTVAPLPVPMVVPDGFVANDFMVNIGLALKELPPGDAESNVSLVNFNILPDVYQPKALPIVKFLVPIGIVVIIAAVAIGGFIMTQQASMRTEELHSEIAIAESSIAQEREQVNTLNTGIEIASVLLPPMEQQAVVFDSLFTQLTGERLVVDLDLPQIVERAKDDVRLTQFDHQLDTVSIGGLADTEEDVFKYARSLKGSGRFREVVIQFISQDIEAEEGEEPFQFGFYLIH